MHSQQNNQTTNLNISEVFLPRFIIKENSCFNVKMSSSGVNSSFKCSCRSLPPRDIPKVSNRRRDTGVSLATICDHQRTPAANQQEGWANVTPPFPNGCSRLERTRQP